MEKGGGCLVSFFFFSIDAGVCVRVCVRAWRGEATGHLGYPPDPTLSLSSSAGRTTVRFFFFGQWASLVCMFCCGHPGLAELSDTLAHETSGVPESEKKPNN